MDKANCIKAAFASVSEFQVSDGKPPAEFCVFPAGIHDITAFRNEIPISLRVLVDESTAAAMQKSLDEFKAASEQRPYFDFDHDEEEASAWPTAFRWEAGVGVMASVEWSKDGEEAVVGKSYRAFSPAFFPDGNEPSRVVGAPFVMGGLVNDPAFRAIPPLWAKDATEEAHKAKPQVKENPMSTEIAAAVAAPAIAPVVAADASANELAAIKAKLAEVEAINKDLEGKVAIAAKSAPIAPAGVVVQEITTGGIDALREMAKVSAKDSRKRGEIYCRSVRDMIVKERDFYAVLAANSLGSLGADLVSLRALDLLKLSFPILSKITTDFSDSEVKQGKKVTTRIIGVPSVTTYDDSTGWADSDASATDVDVTMGAPVGVQIKFNNTELAGTGRDLFGEQVAAAHYALGKNAVDTVLALITVANFSVAGGKTTKALASFARSTVIDMGTALGLRGVPAMGRTLILEPNYFGQLSQDGAIVSLAAFQQAGVITSRVLPNVSDFEVLEVASLPATVVGGGTLKGFAFTKDALAFVARVPEDYTKAIPGAAHGNVSIITNPDSGLSVQKVDFVDHKLGRAYSRIAACFGAAKGQIASGQLLVNA